MQPIRMQSFEKKEVEPVAPILENIYQGIIPIKKMATFFHNEPGGSRDTASKGPTVTLRWPHFDNESRVQEKQQVKDQQSCIFIFVACLTIPSSN